jgi:hypothetical protein
MKHLHCHLIATLALLLLAIATTAAGGGPPSGTISVSPNTGPANGQTVEVSGSNFQKNRQGRIVECRRSQNVPHQGGWQTSVCTDYSVPVTTDANGKFSAQNFNVSTFIQGHYWSHGHNVPATYDCKPHNDCRIFVCAPVRGTASASKDISFSP